MMEKIKYIISVIYTIFKFFENCIIIPGKKFLNFIKPITSRYRKVWNKFVYDKYGDFLWKKAFQLILLTVFGIYAIFCILGLVFDTSYYLLTKRYETIYLSDSVELEEDLWSAKGCPTKECNSDTALYFRIKNTWFNNLWNIFHNGQIFFPDGIAAGVPTGQTECNVISYGLRYRIIMVFNYYPQILQVECK